MAFFVIMPGDLLIMQMIGHLPMAGFLSSSHAEIAGIHRKRHDRIVS
jgi:hypothetical protein